MNERINKTSICSVVFLDIIGYSKKPVAEQLADKERFNTLINEAVKDVAQNDRILLDTGDGAAIALLGAPEEALFISLTIRDGIIQYNKEADQNLFVRIGINLGPVRMLTDINGQANIIGDGINVAQRVMSFAEPNQILVSRSYYEITSRLTKEITEMFAYSGLRHDKHVREHEVYEIRSANANEPATSVDAEPTSSQEEPVKDQPENHKRRSLMIGLAATIGLVIVVTSTALHFSKSSKEQATELNQTNAIDTQPQTISIPAQPTQTPALDKSQDNQAQVTIKAAEKSADSKPKPSIKKVESTKKKTDDVVHHEDQSKAVITKNELDNKENSKVNREKTAEKSGGEEATPSMQQGTFKRNCSQGEIAMGQCH